MDHVQQQSRDAEQRTALAYCAGCAALLITLVCVAARAGDVVVDQGPPRPDVILVTGFRDFNGEENPSAVAATRLNGTGSITSVVLPVDEAGVSYAAGLVSRGAVAAVVHLGLEDATRDLRVEVAGHNILAGPRGAPNSGNCTTRPVFAGEPCTLATTANLGRLALRVLTDRAGVYRGPSGSMPRAADRTHPTPPPRPQDTERSLILLNMRG